jgi:hypothetical protein
VDPCGSSEPPPLPGKECLEVPSTFQGKSKARSMRKLRELLGRNFGPNLFSFVLTYSDPVPSFSKSLKQYNSLTHSLRARYPDSFKSLMVPELGVKSGRLHLHCVFHMPPEGAGLVPKLHAKYGSCESKQVFSSSSESRGAVIASKLAAYITKQSVIIPGQTRSYYLSKGWNSDKIKGYATGYAADKIEGMVEAYLASDLASLVSSYSFTQAGIEYASKSIFIQNTTTAELAAALADSGVEILEADILQASEAMKAAQLSIQAQLSISPDVPLTLPNAFKVSVQVCTAVQGLTPQVFLTLCHQLFGIGYPIIPVLDPIFWCNPDKQALFMAKGLRGLPDYAIWPSLSSFSGQQP